MKAYLDLLRDVRHNGVPKSDRTGTGTLSVFGRQFRHDLRRGFPLLTTKRVFTKGVIIELLWFISGSTNIKPLVDNGVSIWTDWPLKRFRETTDPHITKEEFEARIRADEVFAMRYGDLGPVYGAQWRNWRGYRTEWTPTKQVPDYSISQVVHYDQLQALLDTLKTDPDSRRMVISAWNVAQLSEMALAPCHCLFQFNTEELSFVERSKAFAFAQGWDNFTAMEWCNRGTEARTADMDAAGTPTRYLDLRLDQRSADIFLGVPFNIASYALLLHLVARHVNMIPRDFVHQFGDLHLYSNHVEQADLQLTREERRLPDILFTADAPTDIFAVRPEHIMFGAYAPHEAIKAPVAV